MRPPPKLRRQVVRAAPGWRGSPPKPDAAPSACRRPDAAPTADAGGALVGQSPARARRSRRRARKARPQGPRRARQIDAIAPLSTLDANGAARTGWKLRRGVKKKRRKKRESEQRNSKAEGHRSRSAFE